MEHYYQASVRDPLTGQFIKTNKVMDTFQPKVIEMYQRLTPAYYFAKGMLIGFIFLAGYLVGRFI